MKKMKGYELLWGATLPNMVSYTIRQAIETGTAEAFHDAAQQLRGVQRFIHWMQLPSEWTVDATLALGNDQRRMERFATNTELREELLKFMKGKTGDLRYRFQEAQVGATTVGRAQGG